jgi:murein DD-endopeptidase MepM/ murein hydrolase activator NlpD
MHMIITDAWLAKSRPVHLTGTKLLLAGAAASVVLMLVAVGLYHWVFLTGARAGWPVVSQLVRLVTKDEFEQRDRFMRENVEAMAKRVGEMQVRMSQLESMAERVGGLTGVALPPAEGASAAKGGQGGVLVTSLKDIDGINSVLDAMESRTGQRLDLLSLAESKLFEQRMTKAMVPTGQPVSEGTVGSPFGWRTDPFTRRSALHTGLDFQADPGTPILAAAGGIVVVQEYHAGYGNMVEIDHGNDLLTRYAHASQTHVKKGDVVKRGQHIADVGSTGRSTGPHLHFEVLVAGVHQDPARFLAAGQNLTNPPPTAKVDVKALRQRR